MAVQLFVYFLDVVVELAYHFFDQKFSNSIHLFRFSHVHVIWDFKLVGVSALLLINHVVFVVLEDW